MESNCTKSFPLPCQRELEKKWEAEVRRRVDSPYELLIVQEHTDLRGGLGWVRLEESRGAFF